MRCYDAVLIRLLSKPHQLGISGKSDEYSEKILKLAYRFCPYFNTYVLWDSHNLLEFKDSPCDKGKTILEQLMKTKMEVTTEDVLDK